MISSISFEAERLCGHERACSHSSTLHRSRDAIAAPLWRAAVAKLGVSHFKQQKCHKFTKNIPEQIVDLDDGPVHFLDEKKGAVGGCAVVVQRCADSFNRELRAPNHTEREAERDGVRDIRAGTRCEWRQNSMRR